MKPFNPFERGPLMDPVTTIVGGISAGTNLISSIIGRRSAKKAAQTQADAARQAAETYDRTAREVNPEILDAARRAGEGVTTAATEAATGARTAAEQAAAGVTGATTEANKLLDPYSEAGAEAIRNIQGGLTPGGDFNKTPTLEDIQIDPGYAFRLAEAQKALERSAVARGGALGGGAARALTRYSQDAASQEYSNAFQRFRQSTQDRFNRLFGVSEAGRSASTTQGGRTIDSARYGGDIGFDAARYGGDITTRGAEFAGNANVRASEFAGNNLMDAARIRAGLDTDAAAAEAAGQVAGTNALAQGIVGAGQGIAGTLQWRQLMRNPTAVNKLRGNVSTTQVLNPWELARR